MVRTYLLDTNQVSKLLDGHASVIDRVAQVGLARVAISAIVAGELVFMARRSRLVDDNQNRVVRLCDRILVLPVDEKTAAVYGELKQAFLLQFGPKRRSERSKMKPERLGLRDNDLWIVATALQHKMTLVSADQHFERIRQVRSFPFEAWWAPEP